MIQGIVHRPHLIGNHAGCGNIEFRQIDNQIRLAQCPDGPILFHREQWIAAAAARRTGFDPMHQRLGLLVGERAVVAEDAIVRIGMPWRHALGSYHFTDHRREAKHHVVARHLPGRDAALAVAGDAMRTQHGRDGLFVRDLRMRLAAIALRHEDGAAAYIALRDQNLFTAQSGIECISDIIIRARLNGAAIDYLPALRIQNQHFTVASSPKDSPISCKSSIRTGISLCVGARFRGNGLGCVFQIGIDRQEFDALRLIFCAQRAK